MTTVVIARFGVSASSKPSAGSPASAVTVHAAKLGNPRMNLQDGRAQVAKYKNAATGEVSTAVNGARPLSLATGDLNVDGYPDLLCGYTGENGSFVTVSLGNPEAFGPTRRETIDAVSTGNFHDSFLPDAVVVPVPVAPDFLAVGDFDRDGQPDILTATRGNDTIYIAEGREAGGFSEPQALHLPGAVTALVSGQTDNALGEVAIGIANSEGSQVLVYASKESVLTGTPVSYSIPAMATDISLGQLDQSSPMDLAVAAGNEVLIIHDAGQGTLDQKSAIEHISFAAMVSAVTMGDFIADRANQNELAALSNDGALHVLSRGQLDTRPFTEKEMFEKRQHLAALREQGNFGAIAPAPWRAADSKAEPWTEVKSFAGSGSLWNSGSAQRLLTAAKVATGPGEQLMVLDTANNQVQIVMNDQPEKTGDTAEGIAVPTNLMSVDLPVEGVPVAALSMRLSVMGLPGLVVLSSNQSAPAVLPNAPMATFPVTKAADTNDGACNADCSLREAVVAANAAAGADIITFNAGINPTLTITSGGASENSAASGDLDINDSTTITGNAPTTISTSGYTNTCGDCKVFGIDQTGGFPSLAVSFSGVTIQNGVNTTPGVCGTFFETGGGIDFFLTGTGNVMSMATSTVQNNTAGACAASHGGGVNVDSANSATVGGPSAGTVTFTSVTVTKNSALHEGGGLNLAADKHDVTMTNCVVGGPLAADANQTTDTTSTSSAGGGIDVEHSFGGTVQISGGSIQNNSAISGGGLVIRSNENATISNVTISNNTSTGAGATHGSAGGGVAIVELGVAGFTATISFSGCTISNNHSDVNNGQAPVGGGVYMSSAYAATLSNCTVSGNTSGSGAGMYNAGKDIVQALTLSNGTSVSTNAAAAAGGGIMNANSNAAAIVLDGTAGAGIIIDNNTSGSGGDGIEQEGTAATAMSCSGTVSLNNNDSINITAGTFTSTSGTLNLGGNLTVASGSIFAPNAGTVNFNGTAAQAINGTATSENFNNFIVNKTGTLSVGGSTTSLSISGNVTLTAGTFAAGTATAIGMTTGNWTNNGATFTPNSSVVSFTNTGGAQAINGSAATQTFNGITVAKTAQTLSVAGSTTTLNLNGSMLLTSGTFAAGTAANINVGGDWTNNGGTFTPGTGLVTFNGGAAQNLNGTAATQTFNNFAVNKGGGTLTVGGSTTTLNVNGVTLTAGTFAAGTAANINPSGDWTNNGGVFTPGAGTVNFNNTSAAQALNGSNASQTFNNIAVAKTAQTLSGAGSLTTLTLNGNLTLTSGTFAAGTITGIGIGGNWTNNGGTFTPGSSTVTFNSTTAGQNINGTAATQTFNNLTVSKSGQTLTGGGSTTTLTVNDFSITAGTFAPGTITTMNVAGNWANSGTFTSGSSTVVFNGNNNTQTLTGTTSFNNLTSNHTGTGTVTASGSTLTVTGLLRIQAGTFTSSSTFANVQIDSGATLAGTAATTMNVSGNWTNNGGTFTPNGNTVNFNGGAAQAINGTAASQTFNNFIVNKSGGTLSTGGSTTSITTNDLTMTAGTFTAPATLDINGNTVLTAGTLTAGTAITAAGNWTNNGGTFTAGAGTVTFDGGAGQTIGGTTATTFNNLTNSDAGGISMSFNNTVNGVLALTSSDITVAATRILTQPVGGSSTGGFDVNGQVQRTGFVTGGAALSFGNPFNSIQVTAGTAPANIVVNLARSVPTGGQGFPTAVQRTYTITPNTSAFTATIRLHYLPAELNGNDPTMLNLWRFDSGINAWRPNPATARDCAAGCTTNNSQFWAERSGVTTFSPWTLNSTVAPTASGSVITGRIVDDNGNAVAGAVVRLSGAQNRKFITDANGVYRFENVATNGFYTVTPSRVNYTFNPAFRSFSQLGDSTEAAFGATLATSNLLNPLDTPEYFVRQHYVDFLGREPDEAGFNFWSDQIISCGADTDCVSRRRENVSAAYFLSIEFQKTGGLVDGLYRASYGVRPDFAGFMPDTRTVGMGVVVGMDGWEAKLQANKEAFANAFANRAAFHQMYDGMDNSLFVDTLIGHTGVSFTAADRDALVSGLSSGTMTRGDALRSIAENQRFVNAKFNETFVMMEYFGYLRRDPDASGFAFWLQKLNDFSGNFEQADMVKAFIVSGEFRDRFPR